MVGGVPTEASCGTQRSAEKELLDILFVALFFSGLSGEQNIDCSFQSMKDVSVSVWEQIQSLSVRVRPHVNRAGPQILKMEVVVWDKNVEGELGSRRPPSTCGNCGVICDQCKKTGTYCSSEVGRETSETVKLPTSGKHKVLEL